MKAVSNISSFASIISFLIFYISVDSKPTTLQYILLAVFGVASVVQIIILIVNHRKNYKNEKEINSFMLDWISNIGRIVIFTRDLSWGGDQTIKNKLCNKAMNDELIICAPQRNELMNELEARGAKIITYHELNYTPNARFTIIRYGRGDSKIAIGKTYGTGKHYISEFESGTHPEYHLAADMVNILMKLHENRQ